MFREISNGVSDFISHGELRRIVIELCLNHLGSSGSSLLLAVGLMFLRNVGFLIGLVRAVDGDLDSNLTTLNLLSVHLLNSLVLLFLGAKGDETEATALTALVAGLELLDHETRNGAQGDLGRDRVEASEDVLELCGGLAIERPFI